MPSYNKSMRKTMLIPTDWSCLVLALLAAGLLLLKSLLTGDHRPRLPLPPGPRGVPILGYLPFLGADFHLKLTALTQTYGSVYQMFLGAKRVVVVSDPQLVRKAFGQRVFSGRPDTELTKLLQGYGIVNSEGPLWKEQRGFLHSVLREFGAKNTGDGKAALEYKIQTQVQGFLKEASERGSAPCRLRPHLARAVSNVVGSLLMSITWEAQDPGFRRLLELIDEGFSLLTVAVPVNFIPALRYLPLASAAYKKIAHNKQETHEYFRRVADQHRRTLDPDNVRDIVDAYLVQLDKRKADQTYFSENQLIQVLSDIYSAGLETVTSTLEWTVLFLVRCPDVQKRVQDELDSVVGRDRLPELSDLPHLPYTEATILEVLRRANVIVLGSAHATTAEAELAGFRIPKDTHVLPNLWAIHMDPDLWEDPDRFNPDRFLTPDNKVFKPDFFMPFSIGRRMCLGDTLTKMEVFLFMSGLLHQFNLSVPEGHPLPSTDGIAAVSLTAAPFQVCTIQRDTNRLLV